MESFEFQRRPIAQGRMAPLGVIPTLDEIEHGLPRLGMRGQGHAVEQFALQRLNDPFGAQVVRHRPAHNPPPEPIENDSQLKEADQRRHVGDIGDPQAIPRVGLKVPLDPVWCRRNLRVPTRRARPTVTAHTGDARSAHHPRHPLAAAGMDRLDSHRQLRIGLPAGRPWPPTPSVVPARGDAKHSGQRGDTKTP